MLSVITPAQVGSFQHSAYGFPPAYPDFAAIQQQKWQQMSQAFKQQQQHQSSLWSSYTPPSYPSTLQSGRSQSRGLVMPPAPSSQSRGLVMPSATTKDFSKPLFVDCSIEYELPNAPKIPKNSEPILMIHPSYPKKKATTTTPSATPMPCSAPNCRCNLRKRLQDKVQRTRYHPVAPSTAVKRTYDCIHEERKANANYKHFLLNSNQGLFPPPQQFGFADAPLRRPLDAPPAAKRGRMSMPPQHPPQQQQQHMKMMPYPAIQQSLSYPLQTWGYPPHQQITPPETYVTDSYWGRPNMYDHYVHFSAAAQQQQQQQFYYPRKQSVCMGCVHGKCPQQTIQWNKENMGLMRSL